MKVIAVKGVEAYGEWWAVRYTRLTKRGVKQIAYLVCNTHEQAREKHQELLDILKHHDGVYISVTERLKAKASSRRSAKRELFARSNAGILQQAVLHAIANGYDFAGTTPFSKTPWKKLIPHAKDILFSRDFAKALGYKLAELGAWCDEEKDPFQYIAQFL
jgi:hypothetical protein